MRILVRDGKNSDPGYGMEKSRIRDPETGKTSRIRNTGKEVKGRGEKDRGGERIEEGELRGEREWEVRGGREGEGRGK